ncbi:Shedu immune nuclease family protein [Bradyrhizobium sp. SZCCHNS3002]|uniref:Shedu immune nuclease family protein n=1 Tax=Bradyrhizobium sp. SZCCHNS3002 TaxID=3057310 RepID=UPI0028E916B3|nr:Shedu immune nuclease family protein [Bradyrhizobium sp. SZCCHNS3002]
MISFEEDDRGLVLLYEVENNDPEWASKRLKDDGKVTVSNGFTFEAADLLKAPSKRGGEEPIYEFHFAEKKAGYYRIPGRILGCDHDVLIAVNGLRLERKTFIAERNIRIFPRIEKVKRTSGEIVVGGSRQDGIPVEIFRELLAKFPNSTELDRYASARVEAIVGEILDGNAAAREKYEAYLERRGSAVSAAPLDEPELIQAEIDKYVLLRDTILAWLADATAYSEKDWQRLIIKVILLLFPKYIAVLEGVTVADFYSRPGTRKNRFIDICLIDAGGSIDVIEIKKPFNDVLLSRGLYRGNNIPTKELSGTIMQAEKYLFHLSKWGVEGERQLTRKYANVLPNGMQIRVTSPKAMILLGRDKGADGKSALADDQLFDLEVIKRKYSNMMDILTYDDLVRRLDNVIVSLFRRRGAGSFVAKSLKR